MAKNIYTLKYALDTDINNSNKTLWRGSHKLLIMAICEKENGT